jgi:xylulose-5-phosphate/fructose-6-phosphate phosphoketolase
MVDERLRHRRYTRDAGDDMPETRDWRWPGNGDAGRAAERGAPA